MLKVHCAVHFLSRSEKNLVIDQSDPLLEGLPFPGFLEETWGFNGDATTFSKKEMSEKLDLSRMGK